MIWYQAVAYNYKIADYISLGWHTDKDIAYQRGKASLLRMERRHDMPTHDTLLRHFEILEYNLNTV